MRFRDRAEAGRVLAEHLARLTLTDPVILGLPRGGVPVAAEVARLLGGQLDVIVARKVGAPGHEEFGIGAVAEGNVRIADAALLRRLGISDEEFGRLAEREEEAVATLVARYRPDRPLPDLRGRDVVLVDDGLATGSTASAALYALRRLEPAQLVLAEPVCAHGTAARLDLVADRVVCAHEPARFHSVGEWYEDFSPTADHEVIEHLSAGAGS